MPDKMDLEALFSNMPNLIQLPTRQS